MKYYTVALRKLPKSLHGLLKMSTGSFHGKLIEAKKKLLGSPKLNYIYSLIEALEIYSRKLPIDRLGKLSWMILGSIPERFLMYNKMTGMKI